jgi:hypothetical protein
MIAGLSPLIAMTGGVEGEEDVDEAVPFDGSLLPCPGEDGAAPLYPAAVTIAWNCCGVTQVEPTLMLIELSLPAAAVSKPAQAPVMQRKEAEFSTCHSPIAP